MKWSNALFAHQWHHPDRISEIDSAPNVPRSIVVDTTFDWGDDAPPGIPLHKSVIYETHVRGMTMLHPDVPEELRGTFAGMSQRADHRPSRLRSASRPSS